MSSFSNHSAPEATNIMTLTIGKRLFSFHSFQSWVNHANHMWKDHGVRSEYTVCVDTVGRICTIGKHFMKAEEDKSYPITVYLIRGDL